MPRRNRRSPILTDAEAASKVASLPVKASVSILSRTTLPTHSIRIEHKHSKKPMQLSVRLYRVLRSG